MRFAVALGLCALASLACAPPRRAAGPPPRPVEEAIAGGPAAPLAPPPPVTPRQAELKYQMGKAHIRSPVVRGTLGGQPMWMLIDTGASGHVIAGWAARKAGLPLVSRGEQAVDHGGRPFTVMRAERPPLEIEGWGHLDEKVVMVADLPGPLESMGLGAILSPQQLREGNGAVVVDLAKGVMRSMETPEALTMLEGRGRDVAENPFVCENTKGDVRSLAFVLPASINGTLVSLMLDTGADYTDVFAVRSAVRPLVPKSVPSKGHTFSAGGELVTRTVKGARLVVGSYSRVGDIVLLPGNSDAVCPRDGVLGMDVLKSCVIVFERNRVHTRC